MEFLKEILGDELFSQFETKINAYNADEANKDKQIKLGNLSTGDYVGKGKFEALQELLNGKDTELTNANKLIEDLKKNSKNDEGLQAKINDYEIENKKLQEELAKTKINASLKVALLAEKAVDIDYLTFKLNEKLKEKNEALELDENGNIKGWDDKLAGLKTQFPTMFETCDDNNDGYQRMDDGRLPGTEGKRKNEPSSLVEALQMQYEKND